MKKSKRIKKSNSWKIRQHRDQFFKKSKILGYRSRASFKLIELNQKFNFIKKKSNLLDLGSFPGGWSQVSSKIITTGKVLAVDVKSMEPIDNVEFFKGDILEATTKKFILNFFKGKIDVVISDMACDTTGSKSLDSIRTNQLCAEAIKLSSEILDLKGIFVSKLFMGDDFILVKNLAKSIFKKVNFFKPKSSRSESKETYIHCEILKTL